MSSQVDVFFDTAIIFTDVFLVQLFAFHNVVNVFLVQVVILVELHGTYPDLLVMLHEQSRHTLL